MKKLALLIGFMALLASGAAHAVPKTMSFTGRLTTSTGPVTGSVNLTFRLFDVATGGSAVWTEVRSGIGADNGLVFLDLGEVTPLDPTDFTGPKMYLEIQVGTETLAPRLAINSVPLALRSEDSDTLGGLVTAADVVTTVNGSSGIAATKTGNTVAVSLSTTGCSTGQVYKYNGSSFACAADNNTVPVAGAGISVAGSTVSLSTTGCAAGYVWKWSGSVWSCAADANTTYAAGAGISISGTTVSLSTTNCLSGYVWKYNGATWSCVADADTTYTNGTGLTLTGTTFAIDSSIVARKDAAAGNQAFDANTLYLDYTNNRVGVGTAAPGAPLDVVGNMRAGGYSYAAARTGYFYIAGNSMTPNLDFQDEEWNISSSGYGYIGGGVAGYAIPLTGAVTVPNGVTLTSLFCHYYDNDTVNGLSISAQLYNRPYTSASVTLMGSLSASTTAAGAATTISTISDTTITAPVVANDVNHYYFYVSFTNTTNFTINLRLYGCGVTYTYTSLP
ncbi:MAG TPA: hypothetical protein VNO30_42675 [Kofleriaceae bacterium]|nr:hypothetical protein [Kofleriaceae bacterium]